VTSVVVAWPIAVVAWSLPEELFNTGKLAHETPAIIGLTLLLPVLIAVWAVTELPGFVLPGALIMGWTLVVLSVVDARTYLLPDCLTLPLIAVGVIHAALADFLMDGDPSQSLAAAFESVIAAITGYGVMAIIALVFKKLRGREGLGLGDAKLLAGAGAWLGIAALPTVVLLAALSALVISLLVNYVKGTANFRDAAPLPFGPYLAAGMWIASVYGPIFIG
jgi:leader peptidase (prepilin peptidase)/N-methyltransferase